MSRFTLHTTETAPEASKPTLKAIQAKFGFVPNLFAVFAGSPALVTAYAQLVGLFETTSSFDATERQVVLLEASRVNGCDYCMAGHSVIAAGQGVPAEVIAGLRDGKSLADPRLEALRRFTRLVVVERGHVPQTELDAFLSAGFDQQSVLDVIVGVGLKTLSNYTNHIAHTPLDDAFASQAWKPAEGAACSC